MQHIWNYIGTIIVSSLASATVTAALLLVVKTWITERLKQGIKHEYDMRLELNKATFKADFDVHVAKYQAAIGLNNSQVLERLRADLAVEAVRHKAAQDSMLAERQAALTVKNAEIVERLRAELQILAAQRQTVHKNVYERELEAIAETYENISNVLETCTAYLSIAEIASMGSKAERRVALNLALEKFRNKFRLHRLYLPRSLAETVQAFASELFKRANTFAWRVEHDTHNREATEFWMKVDEYMETEAPALFEQLDKEFRRRLGQSESVGAASAGGQP